MAGGVNGASGNQPSNNKYEKELKQKQENLNDGIDVFYNSGEREFSVFEFNENTKATKNQVNDFLYKAGGADADELSSEYMDLVFNTLDYDGDGFLDYDELSQIAAKGGNKITDFSLWSKLSTKTAAVTDGVFSVSADDMAKDGMKEAVQDVFGADSKEYKAAEAGQAFQSKRQTLSADEVQKIAQKIVDSDKKASELVANYEAILTDDSLRALTEQITIIENEALKAASQPPAEDGEVTPAEDTQTPQAQGGDTGNPEVDKMRAEVNKYIGQPGFDCVNDIIDRLIEFKVISGDDPNLIAELRGSYVGYSQEDEIKIANQLAMMQASTDPEINKATREDAIKWLKDNDEDFGQDMTSADTPFDVEDDAG